MSFIILNRSQLTPEVMEKTQFDDASAFPDSDFTKYVIETDDPSVLALVPEQERFTLEQIKVVLLANTWQPENRDQSKAPPARSEDHLPQWMQLKSYEELKTECRRIGFDFKVKMQSITGSRNEDDSRTLLLQRGFSRAQADKFMEDTGLRKKVE